MEKKLSNININLEGVTETITLVILGVIAITAMFVLGLGGKEIALAIGSSIGGYLTKSSVEKVKKEFKKESNDDKISG